MSEDKAILDPQKVANGLHFWEAATTDLKSKWDATVTQILAKSNDSTWGADEPGQNFKSQYDKSNGTKPSETAKPVLEDGLYKLGPNVKTAVEATMQADHNAALRIKAVKIDGKGQPS